MRYAVLAAIGVVFASAAAPPATAQSDATRAAIIDAAWDVRPYLDGLKANGVLVVGRYLARCPQPERHIPEKRLIDQGPITDRNSEVRRILGAGMAILSIYQYNNDSKNKFLGKDRDGKPLKDGACQPTRQSRTPKQEAALDAQAAVTQARALGQPRGSAIYFGVDIAFSANDATTRRAMVAYFKEVRRILRRGRFRLGAYGNGDALEILEREGLIDYAWISASRAFPGSTRYHNSGKWHLFQNRVNLEWFTGSPGACRRGLPLDTNVKNIRFADTPLGFWRRDGVILLPPQRTKAVFDSRRFACDGKSLIRRTASSGTGDLASHNRICRNGRTVRQRDTVDFANTARLGRRQGSVVEIDYDEDGTFDGWTAASNLTPHFGVKPEWVFRKATRERTTCP
ncbi:MAG: DUF1906 domain-containing protein [Devosia sp.]